MNHLPVKSADENVADKSIRDSNPSSNPAFRPRPPRPPRTSRPAPLFENHDRTFHIERLVAIVVMFVPLLKSASVSLAAESVAKPPRSVTLCFNEIMI